MKTLSTSLRVVLAGSVVLSCFLVAALAQDVHYNYVPGTNFTKYKTYKWVDVPGSRRPDQILDGQIKQAIDSQLSMKGLTRTEDENADLYVAYQVAIDQQKQWNAYGTGGYGRWGAWRGLGTTTVTSSTINVGTLVLDFYDVATKQQVWRGDATKTLHQSKDPQKNIANLQKAMAKLLKNYPPSGK